MSGRTHRPNIIVIFCDDLGYGDLACYGSPVNRTPRLDAMAAGGARFTDFYVSAPVCSPSRASLLTGCYAQRVGLATGETFGVLMPGDSIGLGADEITVADILRRQGYATKVIGKWHVGDQPEFLPTRHGFDSFFGLPYSNDMQPAHPGNDRWNFPPLPLMRDEEIVEIEPDQALLEQRYTDLAVEFIRENDAAGRPFFLYFPHMYVHCPLYPPPGYAERAANGDYGAEVEYLDDSTGRILDTLDELGIAEDTLVIFTSDNGSNGRNGGSNAPLRGQKGTTWEGGMREPCIMHWPGTIPAGLVCRGMCSAMDFLPTFARLAGTDAPDDRVIDGRDILPLMTDPGAETPHEAMLFHRGYHLDAVRSGRWKLHVDRDELYDLEADVAESRNVIDDHPNVVRRLRALSDPAAADLGEGDAPDWSPGAEPPARRPGAGCRPAGRVQNPTTLTPRP